MAVAAPWWLLVATIAASLAWWLAGRCRLARAPRAAAAVGAALLALAPAGLSVPGPEGPLRIVVVDRSAGMAGAGARALRGLGPALLADGARAGIVGVARSAWVEREPRAAPLPYGDDAPPAERTATRVAAGLAMAARLAAPGAEVVCLTDGRDGGDDAALADAGRALASRGARLSVVACGPEPGPDAAAVALTVPARCAAAAPVPVAAVVRLDERGRAEVEWRRDGEPRGRESLTGRPGELRALAWSDAAGGAPGAVLRYRIVVSAGPAPAAPDGVPENGAREALCVVAGPPRVLAVSRAAGGGPVARALAGAAEWRLEAVAPAALPQEPTGYAGVAAVLIEDVPRDAVPAPVLEALADAVRGGLGLVQAGGPGAFGPGGWGGDPLERVAAVRADPRVERPLALALLLDVSGSMAEPAAADDPAAGAKIDRARDAVAAAIAGLRPADALLVVPFRATPAAAIAVGADPGPDTLGALRAALHAGGGTRVWPALDAAAQWLRSRTEEARHCCVVSDGRDPALAPGGADREAAAALLRDLAASGIGVSTIAVAGAADLRDLVAGAGGQAADLTDYRRLSDLLARELRRARGDLEWHGPAVAAGAADARAWLGDGAALPVARAARTALAPDARAWLALPGPGDPPLVATRQAGLGRSAAFTSAPLTDWAPAWASAPGAEALRRLLAWVAAPDAGDAVRVQVAADGDGWRAVVRESSPRAGAAPVVRLASGDAVPARPVAPGVHEARWPMAAEASLGAVVDAATGALLARFPVPGGTAAEWDAAGVDRAGCERIAALAGGAVVAGPAAWRPAEGASAGRRRLDGWCLALAVLALLAAFAPRRRFQS